VYLQRGAFEMVLSDEDQEQDPDRWVSHSPWGQEFWQIVSQWMWNLRLELGHHLHPTPMRTTEVAPAQPSSQGHGRDDDRGPSEMVDPDQTNNAAHPCDPSDRQTHSPCENPTPLIYGPPEFAPTPRAGKFAATAFEPQPDGTLRCPAGLPLYAETRRPERDGTVRVLYAARLPACRGCPLRPQCQGSATKGPRRVSAVVRPMQGPLVPQAPLPPPKPATHPILWGDWSRCQTRRKLVSLLRTQTVTITMTQGPSRSESTDPLVLSRKLRAHWRLSWAQRLARNARSPLSSMVHLQLFGIPTAFARFLGLPAAA
jgi:hypothetical protein